MPPKRVNTDDGPSRAGHSRESSTGSARHAHTPATPSQLRQAHVPSDRSSSPEELMHPHRYCDDDEQRPSSSDRPYDIDISEHGMHPATDDSSAHAVHESVSPRQEPISNIDFEPTARSRLLNQQNLDGVSGYGTTSPRPGAHRNYGSFAGSIHSENSFGGAFPGQSDGIEEEAPDAAHALLGDAVAEGIMNAGDGPKKSTTRWLAERHGVKNQRMM